MNRSHKIILISTSLFALALCFIRPALAQTDRPNILIIVSDDQRDDTLGKYMPIVQEEIFNKGVNFSRGYITTPACCPSRATILTGNYVSKHGTLLNQMKLKKKTLLHFLKQSGYYTGLIGKYLNTWNGSKRKETNYWVSFKGGSSRYFNPQLNVNGRWKIHQGYMTYILRDYVLDFLDQAKQSGKPFFLFFTPNAPHAPYTPPPEDVGRWKNDPLPKPDSLYVRHRQGKPKWVIGTPALTKNNRKINNGKVLFASYSRQQRTEKHARAQLEMLWSLDQAVGSILSRLEQDGILDNTLIFYISDNGVMWGEHSLTSKDCVYEEAIKVPFAMRYPALAPSPRKENSLVANIDIAPTVLDVAGLNIPKGMDGVSIRKILNGSSKRTSLLIEGFRETGPRKPFAAIHTNRYVYVLNRNDISELYDLRNDPYQLKNIVNRASLFSLKKHLHFKLLKKLSQIRRPGSKAAKIYNPK